MGYQLDNNYWKTLVQIVAKGKLCLLFLCIILKAFSHFAHVPCFNSSKTAPTYQLAKAVFMSPLRFVTEYIFMNICIRDIHVPFPIHFAGYCLKVIAEK